MRFSAVAPNADATPHWVPRLSRFARRYHRPEQGHKATKLEKQMTCATPGTIS